MVSLDELFDLIYYFIADLIDLVLYLLWSLPPWVIDEF